MIRKSLLATVGAGVLTFGMVALASENATLLLRSGERVGGQLVDMGGSDFTMSVNGTERHIPLGDVVVIDFTGDAQNLPDNEVNGVPSGSNLITLRNGGSVNGTLYDIGGTSPLRITVRTNGADRDLNSSEIGRIYLTRPTQSVATTGTVAPPAPTTGLPTQGPAPAGSITIPANQAWTSTGVTVKKGDTLNFTYQGLIQLSTDNADIAGPGGSHTGRLAPNAPLPNAAAGALIYKIGNSAVVYPLGDSPSLRMPAAGMLYIGINDDGFSDNQGQYYVTIRKQ